MIGNKRLLGLAVLLVGPGAVAQDQLKAFDPVVESTYTVPRPEYSEILSSTYAQSGNTRQVTIQMKSPVVLDPGSALLLKAYFNDGTILVGCLGSAEVANIPIPANQARLIRGSDLQPLATGTVVTSGDQVTLSVTTNVSRAGDDTAVISLRWVESQFADATTIAARGLSVLDNISGTYYWLETQPFAWASGALFRDAATDQGSAGKVMDYDWRWQVPPIGLPKPADIDGDGRTDWDSKSGTHVEGNTFIDGWVTDNDPNGPNGDSMVVVIGHDLDGDGELSASEITATIGKCVFVPGRNTVKIFPIAGGHVVHVWNWKDSNGDKKWNPGEEMRHYIYNTKTGKLKVFDENGTLLFHGDPEVYFND